jgi:hypothetical protein
MDIHTDLDVRSVFLKDNLDESQSSGNYSNKHHLINEISKYPS